MSAQSLGAGNTHPRHKATVGKTITHAMAYRKTPNQIGGMSCTPTLMMGQLAAQIRTRAISSAPGPIAKDFAFKSRIASPAPNRRKLTARS